MCYKAQHSILFVEFSSNWYWCLAGVSFATTLTYAGIWVLSFADTLLALRHKLSVLDDGAHVSISPDSSTTVAVLSVTLKVSAKTCLYSMSRV